MGMMSSCYIAQWVSSMIPYIMKQRGYSTVNYTDDLGGVNTPDKASIAFGELGKILVEIEILELVGKATPPSTKMIFLGIQLDSVSQTLSIDTDRVSEIKSTVHSWRNKQSASLHELQCLVRMLDFAATCVREECLFFSRILTVLKDAYQSKQNVIINSEMKKDLVWWETFLTDYNGISCNQDNVWSRPDEIFSSDSCLSGCGACSSTHFFHFELPDSIIQQGWYINQFELYVILIVVIEWAPMFVNKNFLIYCDNQTSVQVLHHGHVDCTFMQ